MFAAMLNQQNNSQGLWSINLLGQVVLSVQGHHSAVTAG